MGGGENYSKEDIGDSIRVSGWWRGELSLLACEVRGDGDEMHKFIGTATHPTRANEAVIAQ